MTVTLGEARGRVRRRLEDTTGSPLWADALVDEGLRGALDDYSQWSPSQSSGTFVAAAGDLSASLPAGAIEVARIVDPNGFVIPRKVGDGVRSVSADELTWDIWGSSLLFTRGLLAGTYTVFYTTARGLPDVEGDSIGVPDQDVSLLVAGATVYCIEQRLTAEWKRGELPPRYGEALRAARADYAHAWDVRRRKVRVTMLQADG